VRHQLFHGLSRGHASVELVAIADAALILGVVEIQCLELVEHRPDHLARGRGDAAMHDGDLVLQRRLLRELCVELHVGLSIVVDHLDLPAQQTTRGVGLLDRKGQGVDHRLAVDIEAAGEIVDAGHVDRIFRPGAGGKHRGGSGSSGTLQKRSAIDPHSPSPPRGCR
jgi:hypothetical protein